MKRVVWLGLPCLLVLCLPAQASVLEALGQSLLSAPAADYTVPSYEWRPISELELDRQIPDALGERAGPSVPGYGKPGLFFMPVGGGAEPGLGLGIRFPF